MPSKIAPELARFVVPIDSVQPHPRNPRRGDVAGIAESLEANGQYKPIICQLSTRNILGGNHTYAAAVRKGWTEIAVVFNDVDDEEALRILLSDNRHSDLATYDQFALSELLTETLELTGDLTGTGYMEQELTDLLAELDAPLRLDEQDRGPGLGSGEGKEKADDVEPVAMVRCPDFTAPLPLGSLAGFKSRFKGKHGLPLLQEALDWPQQNASPRLARTAGAAPPVGATQDMALAEPEMVDIDTLVPHPANPRQGDVGAISESLAANGQYRPIVVSVRTRHVLAGTHTMYAARALGWEQVAVTWVDVDEAAEARIVLVDNRLADKGTYDYQALLATMGDLPTLEGTGFTIDDWEDLQAKAVKDDPARKGKAQLVFVDEGDGVDLRLSLRCEWPDYDAWFEKHEQDEGGVKGFVLTAAGLADL